MTGQLSPVEIPILWQRFPKRISRAFTRTDEYGERESRELISALDAASKRSNNNYVDYSIKIDVDKIAVRGNGLFTAADASLRYRGLLIYQSLSSTLSRCHQNAVCQNYAPKVTFKWNLMCSIFQFILKILNDAKRTSCEFQRPHKVTQNYTMP